MNKRALACTPRYPKYLLSHYMDLHHCPQGDPRNGNRWSSWLRGLGTSWREPPETGYQKNSFCLCVSWIYLLVLASFGDGKLRKKSDITKKYLERSDGRNHINHPFSFRFSHWSNVPGFHAPWMDGFRHLWKKTTGSNWNTLWYKRWHSELENHHV